MSNPTYSELLRYYRESPLHKQTLEDKERLAQKLRDCEDECDDLHRELCQVNDELACVKNEVTNLVLPSVEAAIELKVLLEKVIGFDYENDPPELDQIRYLLEELIDPVVLRSLTVVTNW
jgi:hypothetical protein